MRRIEILERHKLDCKCASCRTNRGDRPQHKEGCGCPCCTLKRGEMPWETHPMKLTRISKKIGDALRGRSNPKLAESRKGKKYPKLAEAKRGKSRPNMQGENHPAWQGGTSYLPYPFEFNETLKESIRERDGNVCQCCSKTEQENGKKLTVHHIDYNKENCHPSNLITLCNSCNTKVNCNREHWQAVFEEINCAWLGT